MRPRGMIRPELENSVESDSTARRSARGSIRLHADALEGGEDDRPFFLMDARLMRQGGRPSLSNYGPFGFVSEGRGEKTSFARWSLLGRGARFRHALCVDEVG